MHGVLLMNTVLTVGEGTAFSHSKQHWQLVTNAIIRAVSDGPGPVVFMLWGIPARQKRGLIDTGRHIVIARSHPSPLSARLNFLGTRPFSAGNEALHQRGAAPIDWSLDMKMGA